jgi:YVTN family beta-propeller protein
LARRNIARHKNNPVMRFFTILLLYFTTASVLSAQRKDPYRHPTDDTTLAAPSPIMMPYNRVAVSAGRVIAYGDPRLENHTLDVALMPGNTHIAIEDRFGIAVLDCAAGAIAERWSILDDKRFTGLKNTFSGIKSFVFQGQTYLVWSAAGQENDKGGLLIATWRDKKIREVEYLPIAPKAPAPGALPNEVEVVFENGSCFLYVVLNGNNELLKIDFGTRATVWAAPAGIAPFGVKYARNKLYVSNWAGPTPVDSAFETAGVPYGAAYINPRTGATLRGSVSVFDAATGKLLREIETGLHPNALALSPDRRTLYVANGNSDDISVIDTERDVEIRRIPVGLFRADGAFTGSTPNGLALDSLGETLFVSNGLDHAVAVVRLYENPSVAGYIPTEAFPSGLLWHNNTLYVCNLEARGARVLNNTPGLRDRFAKGKTDFPGAFNAHEQLASLSVVPVPGRRKIKAYTKTVKANNLSFRAAESLKKPRPGIAPQPLPQRVGEPSVFKHVLYIIKENRTYDQVFGDLKQGRGMKDLCVFGDSVTPNQHKLALEYSLLDNYHVAGKSSAEGHQWTDAGIVSDYVEKSVRAWFRSYPHRQYDAMVYTREGFIWNHALDHGKTVRIYGEACDCAFDKSLTWEAIYNKYRKNEPFEFKNTSTISRVRPILCQTFPGNDNPRINDQLRADAFVRELEAYEKMPGDQLPQLMVMALPNDHTAGTSPGFPTPRAMVADNDLALGRIVEALSKSRFWDSTVIFVTEDDSQSGWDHISAYRTVGLVISPYSRLQKTIRTNYNQISMLRSIELILGLPPMNSMDATARPMFECFENKKQAVPYRALANRIALDEMNKSFSQLKGKALFYARQSVEHMETGIDKGDDDAMNRILWFASKGERAYPGGGK